MLHPFASNRFFWSDFFNIDLPYIFVLPESGRNWFINDERNLRYEDYLISELMVDVEAKFSPIKRRVIGGFSMGGAAAFFLALRYPALFDVAFSLAGAFGAADRVGDPYQEQCNESHLMIPTSSEHEKVWGTAGSLTRKKYNLFDLYDSMENDIDTKFVFEVGLQDHGRIIDMNRKAHNFFSKSKIKHFYQEFAGDHSQEYAYQGLDRVIKNYIDLLLHNELEI